MNKSADSIVEAWLLDQWVTGGRWAPYYPSYDPKVHGPVETLRVLSADAGWACGCYSSWTREDSQEVEAIIKSRGGNVRVTYGRYADFPDMIASLLEFGQLEDYCDIERRYAEGGGNGTQS